MASDTTFIVRGTVRYCGGLPAKDITVEAWDININKENLINESALTNDSGQVFN